MAAGATRSCPALQARGDQEDIDYGQVALRVAEAGSTGSDGERELPNQRRRLYNEQ